MTDWNKFEADQPDTHPDCMDHLCLAWIGRADHEGGYTENFPTVACFFQGQWIIEARDWRGNKFQRFTVTRWAYIDRPV